MEGGKPPPRLARLINSKAHGHPCHSHDVERAVGGGSTTKRKNAHSQSEETSGGTTVALLNGTRDDWRRSAYDHEDEVAKEFLQASAKARNMRTTWR